VVVLAAAGSAPTSARYSDAELFARCRREVAKLAAEYRGRTNVSVAMVCERPDGTVADPKLWLPEAPSRPAPIPALTAGQAMCVTGAGRPVAGTTLTSVSATASPGDALDYEYQRFDGGETVGSSGSPVLEFGPGDLAPGASYRWRARIDDTADETGDATLYRSPDDERVWSRWCEFTVAADAIDYRGLGDVSLDALNEIGVRPDRTYAVRLSGRQQRLLRAGTDVGRTGDRMVLTGPRWTDLLLQLTESAAIADEVAAETDDGDPSASDGARYRALVDAISIQLGGPGHPRLD
jgi:hypothetical protein